MIIRNELFSDFKISKTKINTIKNKKEKINIKPVIGATAGVGLACIANAKAFKGKPNNKINEVAKMLIMAGSANIGAVALGSIGKNKDQKIAKAKEAGFQMMNTTIPMLMVTAVLGTCERVKALNNKPAKIIGSFAAMALGAFSATKITNLSREKNEPARKYTIKDSIANFDDVIATISLGFRKILDYVPVDKILPFIYIYCGARAGSKGDYSENQSEK